MSFDIILFDAHFSLMFDINALKKLSLLIIYIYWPAVKF